MATSTITNTITDGSGTAVASVTVVATLMPSPAFRVSDNTEIAPRLTTTSNGSGAWSLALERNANITPTGSWWEIEEQLPDTNGGPQVWAISVGASNSSLQAARVTPTTDTTLTSYITQAAGDARYAPLGSVAALSTVFDVTKAPYSATGDGVADDTSAINAAITAANAAGGGIVYVPVPASSYLVTTIVPKSNVWLVGAGWASKIKLKNSTNPVGVIRNDYTGAAISNFAVCNLQVDGNKANNTAGNGIAIFGGTGLIVKDCYVHDTAYACINVGTVAAAQSSGGGRFFVVGNWCDNPALSGNFYGAIGITGGDDVLVADNICTQSDGFMSYGVDIEPNTSWTTRRVKVTGNVIDGGAISATATAGTISGVTIENNTVNCGNAAGLPEAIKVDSVTGHATVHNNDVTGASNTSAAIKLKNLTFPSCTENKVTGMGAAQNTYPNNVAILLDTLTGGWVHGNHIYSATNTHATSTAGIAETAIVAAVSYGFNQFSTTILAPGKSGATFAGSIAAGNIVTTVASAAANAGLRLPHGAAPTSPVDGDAWTTTAGLFVRINGVTKTVTLT